MSAVGATVHLFQRRALLAAHTVACLRRLLSPRPHAASTAVQGSSALTLQGELVLRIVAAQDIANPPSGSALGQPTWLLQLTDGAECCTAFEWSPLLALHEAGADRLLAVGTALRLINCRVSGGNVV